ncbi:MAG TPA: glutathione peroxidase [Rhodobacteraceae bacterium]|jgi:glutathione peroxidase|nr:glutathione peroxidase [Paracoccaceae bacterium]HBV53847.1 glutathione peroxidase [Paracoccaceae bacterium]
MLTILRKPNVFLLLGVLILTGWGGVPQRVEAAEPFVFEAIEGGTLSLEEWRGRPILVVNTASRCGFTPQYDELQALQDRYSALGLVVLAVPSNDFRQELASEADVKEFCETNFNLTLPMTEITHVKGPEAHPFYRWVQASTGFVPGWNFNKILLAPDGSVAGTFGSTVKPLAGKITTPIEAMLGGS